MKPLEAFNIALNQGLGGLAAAYVKEHRRKTTVQADQTNRLRLSVKFGPLVETVKKRFFDTVDSKSNNPKTTEDTLYKEQVMPFYYVLAKCEEILASKTKDGGAVSVWITFDGDVLFSPYFKLEICSKDGKRVIMTSEVNGIL